MHNLLHQSLVSSFSGISRLGMQVGANSANLHLVLLKALVSQLVAQKSVISVRRVKVIKFV